MRARWFFYLDEDDVEMSLHGDCGAVSPARWRVRPADDLGFPGLTHAALAAVGTGVLVIDDGFRIVPPDEEA